jgi:hypothetical protein
MSSHHRIEVYGPGSNDFRLHVVAPDGLRSFSAHTQDGRFLARDEILSPQPARKVLVLGRVWEGDLKPRVDALEEALAPLTGFTLGHTVGAEQIGDVLDLGRVFNGIAELTRDIRAAGVAHDAQGSSGDDVDVSEMLECLRRLRAVLGTEEPDVAAVTDSVRRLGQAHDRVKRSRLRTGDAATPRGLMRSHLIGTGSKPVSIASINDANREFHSRVAQPVDVARRVPVTDHTPAALNEAARKFWGG